MHEFRGLHKIKGCMKFPKGGIHDKWYKKYPKLCIQMAQGIQLAFQANFQTSLADFHTSLLLFAFISSAILSPSHVAPLPPWWPKVELRNYLSHLNSYRAQIWNLS